MIWTAVQTAFLLALLQQAPPQEEPPQAESTSAAKDAFANPELLVTAEWLAEHSGRAGLVIVDVRSEKDYEAGHLPGAVHVPAGATFDAKAPRGNLAPKEQVEAVFGAQGIAPTTHVVLYDEGRSTSAARVFWTLEVYGHARVSVLDGGIAKWRAEKHAVTQERPEVRPVELELAEANLRLSTTAHVTRDLDADDAVLVDVRSQREWDGGRIPGAVHVEWTLNFTADEVPVFRSPRELRKLYQDLGVTGDKRLHAY